jgi:hypothetical protein
MAHGRVIGWLPSCCRSWDRALRANARTIGETTRIGTPSSSTLTRESAVVGEWHPAISMETNKEEGVGGIVQGMATGS